MKKRIIVAFVMLSLLVQNCTKNDDSPAKKVVQNFTVDLTTSNEIPSVSGRDETGTLTMKLYDDNSLDFTITVNNLASSDALTAAHIHEGDVVSTGAPVIPLVTDDTGISFSGNSATGTIDLTSDQVAKLKGSDIYVNVHSNKFAPGLLRGQVDQKIEYAYNVDLAASNAVPANHRNETGNAIFRIIGTKMFYKITIDNLDTTDEIKAGHIHNGATGATGEVLIDLDMTNNEQLGITKMVELNNDQLSGVTTNEVYVNIHSDQQPTGLVRGQIR